LSPTLGALLLKEIVVVAAEALKAKQDTATIKAINNAIIFLIFIF
jgi:hypothetical protein